MTRAEPPVGERPALDRCLNMLLGQLPLASVQVLAPFVGHPSSTLHRLVNRLVNAGLIDTQANPLPGPGRPGRLLWLSRAGLTAALSEAEEPNALARQLASGKSHTLMGWPLSSLPGLLAAYELLRLLAARRPGSPSLRTWEWQWQHVLTPRDGLVRTPGVVRLPARALIVWATPDGALTRSCQ